MTAPLQAIGMLGVPVTALPSGGLHPACACRGVPSREAAETHPCRIHVWHCPGAPRTSLDSLRAVGAVQAGAAVGAEVVAGLYVDHRVSAHGALLFLANSHPPCAGIRFILLILAGTAPATAAITVSGWTRELAGTAKALVAHHFTCQILPPRHPAYLQVSVFRNDPPSLSCHIPG